MVNDVPVELTPVSVARAANMWNIGLTGAQIAALSPTYANQIVVCNLTGSGFTLNHVYVRTADNLTWKDISVTTYYDISNDNQLTAVLDKIHATKEMWYNSASGTGAAVNNSTASNIAGVDLVTGTTTTGVALLQTGGPTFDFAQKAKFKVKIKTDPTAITGQIVKIGVGIDTAGTGPVTTNNFGIEYCDGNANWQIHSANGTSQSNFDTLKAVAANTVYGFTVEFNPGTNVIATFDDGTVKTKTTHPPTTGAGASDAVFKLSISNNNGSSTSRTLQVQAVWMVYGISDTKWLQQ